MKYTLELSLCFALTMFSCKQEAEVEESIIGSWAPDISTKNQLPNMAPGDLIVCFQEDGNFVTLLGDNEMMKATYSLADVDEKRVFILKSQEGLDTVYFQIKNDTLYTTESKQVIPDNDKDGVDVFIRKQVEE